MKRLWWVHVALDSGATAWSRPFGPYRTEREALRRGRKIGSYTQAVRAEKVVPPTDRELLENILSALTEIRDDQRRLNVNGKRLTSDPLRMKRVS